MAMTPEAKVLARAKKQAKASGLKPIRCAFMPGVESGWPDLLILGPFRCILFMETKSAGKPLTKLQDHRRHEIVNLYGHAYSKPDTKEQVDEAIAAFVEHCVEQGRKLGYAV